MASKSFYDAIKNRRSIYKITNESPVADSRIHEIVDFVFKHIPSSFNVQSSRGLILLKDEHQKFWDIAGGMFKANASEEVFKLLGPKIAGLRGGYGSILFYEDSEALDTLVQKNPMIAGLAPQWSEHTTGMHQFALWTALEAEGFGASLQHYNFMPPLSEKVVEEWKVPKSWQLKAQLVFGKPTAGPDRERTYLPLEERVMISGN